MPAPIASRSAIAAVLVLLATAPAWADDAKVLAVLPLDVHDAHLDSAGQHALEESIRTVAGDALSEYGYTVLTGETTLAVLADNGVDPSKACEASCALQAARELKAQLFISGTVAKSEGAYIAFIRLFENKSGHQLASAEVEGATIRDIRKAFGEKAPAFFAKGLGGGGLGASSAARAERPVDTTGLDSSLVTSQGKPRTLHIEIAEEIGKKYFVEVLSGGKTLKCPFALAPDHSCDLRPVRSGEVRYAIFEGEKRLSGNALLIPRDGASVRLVTAAPMWAGVTGVTVGTLSLTALITGGTLWLVGNSGSSTASVGAIMTVSSAVLLTGSILLLGLVREPALQYSELYSPLSSR